MLNRRPLYSILDLGYIRGDVDRRRVFYQNVRRKRHLFFFQFSFFFKRKWHIGCISKAKYENLLIL